MGSPPSFRMLFCGIDVHQREPFPYAIIDESHRMVDGGWLSFLTRDELRDALRNLLKSHPIAVLAIDAPRQALTQLRRYKVNKGKWHSIPEETPGKIGRHCELVVKALSIGNPQWTPLSDDAPEWMQNGFALYDTAKGFPATRTVEVFPSASYKVMANYPEIRTDILWHVFQSGPKHMLDALIGAVTAAEFIAGRGCAVGGGDGLGEIVLPRPVNATRPDLFTWPDRWHDHV